MITPKPTELTDHYADASQGLVPESRLRRVERIRYNLLALCIDERADLHIGDKRKRSIHAHDLFEVGFIVTHLLIAIVSHEEGLVFYGW